MALGYINKFVVDRETQLGYVIKKDDNEFFLHRNECCGKTPMVGETLEAFIYVDKKGREAATLHLPTITCSKVGMGEVVLVKEDLGAFVNIGISKDILLSKDDLPLGFRNWPKVGDKVACSMKIRARKLVLKLASKNEILKSSENVNIAENEKVDAYVYRITDDGINLVTEDLNVIFVYKNNYRGKYHIGQKANVKIIGTHGGITVGEDGATHQALEDISLILAEALRDKHIILLVYVLGAYLNWVLWLIFGLLFFH